MVFTNRTHKDLKEIKRAKRQSTHSVRENKTHAKKADIVHATLLLTRTHYTLRAKTGRSDFRQR